jgi:uncharacterized protein (TIGR02444 family)
MDPTLDNPFWAFSLRVYGADGVAEECIELQERLSLNVSLLLFAAYAGVAEGIRLDATDIVAATGAVEAWHRETVRRLRAVRRALKPASIDAHNPLRLAVAKLRAEVKAAELEAEKIEQAVLWRWSQERLTGRAGDDARAAFTANVKAVLAHYGAPATDFSLPRLQTAALVFAQSNS